MNAIKSGLEEVRKYWDDKVHNEQDDCARVESGRRGQLTRFANFCLNHDLSGKSILDVGCGVGEFFAHLQRENIDCQYVGVDISPAMIARAKERFPQVEFRCENILDCALEQVFDYTVAFAVHNVRVSGHAELLKALTAKQFSLSKKAAHVDLLTDRYEKFDPHILSWKAEEVFAQAMEITPAVVLRHNYLPNSFSVTLYRSLLIDTLQHFHD